MKLTEVAIKRPITTLMFFFCFVVTGAVATKLMPLEYFPEVQFPGIFIQIPYPNSTTEEIERSITRPVEEVLATMSGIYRMNSRTTDDQAQIEVSFDWSNNPKVKGIEAREKIDAIRGELPDDLRRIFVFTGSTADMPVMQLRISSTRDLSNAYELLDRKLKRPLELIAGVSKVELYGVGKKEIQIQLIPERVAAHRVDLQKVLGQLQQVNFSTSAGEVLAENQRLRVKPIGEITHIDEYRNIIIGKNNLRLSDIADVVYAEPELEDGRHLDQTYAIGMNIQRESSANMVTVADLVLEKLEEIQKSPDFEGINLYVMDNAAEGVVDSINDITQSGLIGFVLSIAVLYFFLRQWSITLIVALAVPFSISITLAFMYFLGLTLNVLSMMGLMLAIGMLVDNAVVISENIFHRRREFPDQPLKAVHMGVSEVGVAVLAGTITTGIVFLPNIIGEKIDLTVFLGHVAVAICISLAASLLIAVTIIPLLLNKVKVSDKQQDAPWIHNLSEKYHSWLSWMVNRPKVSAWIAVGVLLSAAIPLGLVKSEMFPEEQRKNLMLHFNLNGTYTKEKVEESVDVIENYLYANKEAFNIESVYSYYRPELAQSTLLLRDKDERTLSVEEIRKLIEKDLPKIAIGAPAFKRERNGGNEGISVQLLGESTDVLVEYGEEVERLLNSIPGLSDAQSSAGVGEQEIQVSVDRDKAQMLGLNPEQVAQTIGIAMRGQNLRTLRTNEGEVEVKILFNESNRKSLIDLQNIPLNRPGQDPIMLSSVADMVVTKGTERITREDRTTMISVKANLNDITINEAKDLIRPMLDEVEFPTGYSWSFGRGVDRENRAAKIMGQNMLLAVLMIFVVMAALFESMLFPLAVISSILYSFVGVFWFFLLTGTTLSFTANIGMLVLMGVVVNNGIVLIDHINQLRKQGMARIEAILTGGKNRLRPILMTVGTTILGLIPLAIGDAAVGGNGPPYFPMARAIIGGLLFSTVVSLLILPVIYLGLDNLSNGLRRMWRMARTQVFG